MTREPFASSNGAGHGREASDPSDPLDMDPAGPVSGSFARVLPESSETDKVLSLRPLSWLLFLRVLVLSVILAGILAANVFGAHQYNLEGPFAKTVFALIAVLYALSILAGLLAKWTGRFRAILYGIVGIDLLATTFGVHLAGGIQSGFTVLYMTLVVAAGLTDGRRGAAFAMASASLLVVAVSLLDRAGMLPLIAGQSSAGLHIGAAELARHLSVTLAALAAVTILTIHMVDQLQAAGREVQLQRRAFSDLAAHHEQVITSLATGLVSTDRQGVILTFNPKAEELLGTPVGKALGRRLEEVCPSLSRPIGIHRFELDRGDADLLSVELLVSRLTDSENTESGRIYLIRDRTEIERMEREVAEAERLAALGRFASGVAHEIRNPLASISGALELLRQTRPGNEDEARLTEIVLREVDRLDRLISEMLDLVRPNTNTKLELDWGEEIQETTSLARTDPRFTHVTISIEAPEPVMVFADQPRLRQVYWNLLTNALAVSPPNGIIHVTVSRDDAWAVLSVTDQGPGIDTEHIDRIFEPFFSTKSEGTGLGLAIVRQIIQDHGGKIQVESRPGWTRFTVRIPAQDPQDSETPQMRRAATIREPTL